MVPFLLNEVCKLRGTDCLHCIYILFCTVLNADKRDCQEYKKPFYRKNIHIRQTLYLRSEFVCVFAPVFKRVFRGQKIGLRYFKIQGTNFKICALYFFFSPMWVLRAENQFPIFSTKKGLFPGPVFSRFMRFLFPANSGFYSKFAEASCLSPAKEKVATPPACRTL